MNCLVGVEMMMDGSWAISYNGQYKKSCECKEEVSSYCVGFAHGMNEAKAQVVDAVLEGLVDAYQTSELPESVINAVLVATNKLDLKLTE